MRPDRGRESPVAAALRPPGMGKNFVEFIHRLAWLTSFKRLFHFVTRVALYLAITADPAFPSAKRQVLNIRKFV